MRNKKKKKIKSDYQAKNLKNPFYHSRETTKKGKGILFFFLFSIIIAAIIFAFSASFLKIDKIEIKGLSRTNTNEIEDIVKEMKNKKKYLFFQQNNIFLFSKDKLEEKIKEKYNFSQLDIKKRLPNTLKLIISERPYAFIFQFEDKLFYASSDGFIIKDEEVKEEDKEKYFLLENKSQAITIRDSGKINIKPEYLVFVFALNESLNYYSDLQAKRYIIEQELNSLMVVFNDGPTVYFNTQKDPQIQVEDLALVKKEKIGDNFKQIEYIDLRFGEMIFIN